MSSKRKSRQATANAPRAGGSTGRSGPANRNSAGSGATRRWVLFGSALAVALIAVVAGWAVAVFLLTEAGKAVGRRVVPA